MKKLLQKIVSLGALVGILLGANVAMASSIPVVPAVFETYLAAQQLSTDSTLTLASATLRDGSTLSGYVCLTIDSNSSSLEYECGTLSGTSVTGLTRGIDAISGTTTIASLQVTHRRGADVKVTDYPVLTILSRIVAGQDTLPTVLHYATGTTNNAGDLYALATVQYANSIAVAGAPNASTVGKGIVQIGTAINVASSTGTGSTGALLVIPSSDATSTPVKPCDASSVTGALCVVVAQNDGKINPNFVATSSTYTYNFGSTVNLQGTNTISGTGGLLDSASTTITATSTLLKPGLNFTSGSTTSAFPMPFVIATSSNRAFPAISNLASTTYTFEGFSQAAATNGQSIFLQTSGVVSGFSGLSAGSAYYLQDNSGATIGTSPGTLNFLVGYAVSATQLLLNPSIFSPSIVTTTFASPTTDPSTANATVTCPSPLVVSGGGVSGIPAPSNTSGNTSATTIVDDYASASNAWKVTLSCSLTSGAGPACNSATITVYAICVNP